MLIYEYVSKDLKKFNDLAQEAQKIRFFFSFKGRIRDETHNQIKLFMIFNFFDGANGAFSKIRPAFAPFATSKFHRWLYI